MQVKTKTNLSGSYTPTDIITALLVSRGLDTQIKQQNFLHPPTPTLSYLYHESGINKSKLTKMQKILNRHLKLGSDICIFGDYDADGVTATALLYLGLSTYLKNHNSSSRLLPFIPNRHRHGYGLSDLAVAEVISGAAFSDTAYPDFAPKLILTVDTGIVAHLGISKFIDSGIEVIVTDHHLALDTLPPATAIVHTTLTSGAGVAWIIVSHLLGSPDHYLDLATLGIVADMMPLIGFNRSLVTAGLKQLNNTKNLGIKTLISLIGITNRALNTYDISFGIAPRINAAGRIYSPLDALRLLCTSDPELARALAAQIESHNADRQSYTETALTHALSQPHPNKIIALVGPYNEGVIGLVAGKVVEQLYRPAVIMCKSGDIIKGSARSLPGFNITNFLRSLKISFLGLGGHDQAAGFSLAKADLNTLLSQIKTQGDLKLSAEILTKTETADLELPLKAATLSLAKKISELEPYGLGNPKPRFLFRHVKVINDRSLKDGQHHKLDISQDGVTLPLLIFNTKHKHPLTSLSQCIATLDVNIWNNQESPQLIASYVQT